MSCEFTSVSNSLLRVGQIEIGLQLELIVGSAFFKYWGHASMFELWWKATRHYTAIENVKVR